ncbi:MAG: formate/nitrite transporter family protein [Spiroplasma sp.]|nr:formate/nitrite transporter family protein [Spiroplasma sp.]
MQLNLNPNNNKETKGETEETRSPRDTFIEVYKLSAKKAKTPLLKTFLLGITAGAFIGIAWIASIWATRNMQDQGMYNIVFGGVFLIAITMIIFMGGEMFTSNSMMFIPALKKQVKWRRLFANLFVVLMGNFVGGAIFALLTWGAGMLKDQAFLENAWAVTSGKLNKDWYNHFFSGIICNLLVAGSVYITYATKNSMAKLALTCMLIFPFAVSGFSHIVANSYPWTLLPIFNLYGIETTVGDWLKFGYNTQLPTLFGNFIGGAIFLMGTYYLIFRKELPKTIEL